MIYAVLEVRELVISRFRFLMSRAILIIISDAMHEKRRCHWHFYDDLHTHGGGLLPVLVLGVGPGVHGSGLQPSSYW